MFRPLQKLSAYLKLWRLWKKMPEEIKNAVLAIVDGALAIGEGVANKKRRSIGPADRIARTPFFVGDATRSRSHRNEVIEHLSCVIAQTTPGTKL